MLPVEKLSLITLDTAINAILKTGNYGTKLTKVAMDIADTIETEVSITNAKNRRKTLSKTHSNLINKITSSARTTRFLKARIKELNNGQTWSHALKVKLGSALFSLLLRCCHTEDGSMAFIHTTDYDREKQKSISRIGLLQLEHNCYQQIANSDFPVAIPRFLPMLVPPKSWNSKEFDGAYYKLQAPLMKTTMKSQTNAVKNSNIPKVTEGLDYLGSIPWKINRDMLDVVISLWNSGEALGDLPPGQDLVVPEYEEFAESYKEKILSKDISDEIITNKSVKGEDDNKKPFSKLELAYRDLTRRIKKKNAELHSLRCDTKIKLSIANRFVGEKIYYPYNLDFRGRAYPVPPNLTHLGSDLSRGLLTFAEEKILGKKGFMWLKVHLANLFGNNKITLEDRAKWTEDNIENVIDSAENPLTGKKWWQSAEEPFQALATCIEIAKASKLDNPELYQCSLPVHQDGSCNGLQHYAGLGRDHPGAVAVNLVPSNSPQDVYSRVLDIVKEQIEGDASIPFNHPVEMERIKGECARLVKDLVSRKVIKQTVMTSVYGVTRTGARAQIQARLEELVQTDSSVSNVAMDRKLFQAANYLASLTLISLEKMFTSAKEIMDWLATCAVLVSDKVS